jgi:hypothetical protein
MLSRFRPRLTYANVISTLCLFIVLGGGAYAATALPKNSVGSSQLKSGAVTPPKVASKTIKLFKGQNGATNVTAREKSGSIPVTCTGPSGSPPTTYYSCSGSGTVVAVCEPGERATGGSYASNWTATDSGPAPTSGTPGGWFASITVNNPYSASPTGDVPVTVRVVCARP